MPRSRRPNDDVPRRARGRPHASGEAAARTMIEQSLGWLAGFPDRSRPPRGWVVVAPGADGSTCRIVLDRARIHRAVRALRRLERDFPRALPRVVGDVEAWSAAVASRLDDLKPAIHGREAAPPALPGEARHARAAAIRRLRGTRPVLGAVIDAASWSSVVPADRRRHAFAVLEQHAAAFERMLVGLGERAPDGPPGSRLAAAEDRETAATLAVLRLVRIADAIGARDASVLVELVAAEFGPPVLPGAVIDGAPAAVRRVADEARRLVAEGATWARRPEDPGAVLAWLARLARRAATDPASVRTTARLVRALRLEQLLAWRATERGLRIAAAGPLRRQVRDRAFAVAAGANDDRDHAPLESATSRPSGGAGSVAALLDLVVPSAGDDEDVRTQPGLRPVLEAARSPAAATALLEALRAAHPWTWPERRSTVAAGWRSVLPAVRRAVGGLPDDLAPVLRRDLHAGIAAVAIAAVDDRLPGPAAARAVDAFGRLAADDPRAVAEMLEPGPVRTLDDCLLAVTPWTRDARTTGACALAWREARRRARRRPLFVPNFVVETTLRLAGEDPARVTGIGIALLDALDAASDDGHDDLHLERAWRFVAERCGDDADVVRLLLGPQRGRLGTAIRRAAFALPRGASRGRHVAGRGPAKVAAAWIDAWPKSLQPVLARVAAVRPDAAEACAAARRRLEPDVRALVRERDAIAARLETAAPARRSGLERRRASLEQRIEQGRRDAPALRRRLRKRLETMADAARLDAVDAETRRRLADALERRIGTADAERILALPEVEELVAAIEGLEPGVRRLGLRILARRAERESAGPPWDLRDAAANRRFLDAMVARGLDTMPWLDGIEPIRRTIGGRRVTFALERDPLEVLRMGRMFRTCLAPGAMNFYSAVVNAADANKQVVYARADERVVGRCLLVMTDEGRILRFHAYAHEHRERFDLAFTEFTFALGEATGGGVTSAGRVSLLLWRDWYDDGPDGLDGAFAFLDEGSALRRRLAVLPEGGAAAPPAAEVAAMLREETGLAALPPVAAERIIHLPEAHERPSVAIAAMLAADDGAGAGADADARIGRPAVRVDRTPVSDAAVVVAVDRCVRLGRSDLVSAPLVRRHRRAVFGRAYGPEGRCFDASSVAAAARLDPAATLPVLRQRLRREPRDWRGSRSQLYLGIAVAADVLGRGRAAREALHRMLAGECTPPGALRAAEAWMPELLASVAARRDGLRGRR